MFSPVRIIAGLITAAAFFQDVFSLPQEVITISGAVKDSTGHPVENAAVMMEFFSAGTYTDRSGCFVLKVPADGKLHELTVSMTGYEARSIGILCKNDVNIGDIVIRESVTGLNEVKVISTYRLPAAGAVFISPADVKFLPSSSGGFEAVLKTLPGVSSNNEMSRQYSVRGGNYDENLVYINDIEVYRPFLLRSGQQEGLSAINPDLVSSVMFSSGGFSCVYGDRMSSVLDITYRRPVMNRGSATAGLLVSSAHYEGISRSGKVTWLAGARYKSSRMMLRTLDSRGDYLPVFADVQGILTVKTGKLSEVSVFGSLASNTYHFIPRSRESKFGNEAEAYRLFVLFEGREKDTYRTWNTAVTWKHSGAKASNKITASFFCTAERETFDIRGYYSLNLLDKNTGTENFTDTAMNIGTGSFLTHARNVVNAGIFSVRYRGEAVPLRNISLRWGFRLSDEFITDDIKEWKMVDSTGYSVPYRPDGELSLYSLVKGSLKVSALITETYGEIQGRVKAGKSRYVLTGGTRFITNSFTGEAFLCPRASVKIEAGEKTDIWISSGAYYQNPFYREMHFPDGSVNNGIKSQKSWHFTAGLSYDFRSWNRPFRFTAEFYNKTLHDIIPYRLDNVRVIYEGENIASGYSRGIDLRLNGEFVEGAESWFSLSVMDSKLRIPGLIDNLFPSPSDQTLNVSIFFQDYLPGNPAFRAHLTLSYITGLPVISPFNNRYDQYHRLPSYRRVDLGLTRVFKGQDIFRSNVVREIIAGVEIYNLLDINNTVSYFWVKTVNNQSGRSRQYAIPEYLTGRSLNFRITAVF